VKDESKNIFANLYINQFLKASLYKKRPKEQHLQFLMPSLAKMDFPASKALLTEPY
jgi:hypothetical protein